MEGVEDEGDWYAFEELKSEMGGGDSLAVVVFWAYTTPLNNVAATRKDLKTFIFDNEQ